MGRCNPGWGIAAGLNRIDVRSACAGEKHARIVRHIGLLRADHHAGPQGMVGGDPKRAVGLHAVEKAPARDVGRDAVKNEIADQVGSVMHAAKA